LNFTLRTRHSKRILESMVGSAARHRVNGEPTASAYIGQEPAASPESIASG
jgi:hypothetical protein